VGTMFGTTCVGAASGHASVAQVHTPLVKQKRDPWPAAESC